MLADLPLFFINRLLAAEPWASELLRPHVGQTALLELGGVRLRCTVSEAWRLEAASASADATDTVTIRVPATALSHLLDSPDSLNQHAHIEGNAALAETLAKLLRHLRPDLAAQLAPHLGDVAASRIAHSAQRLGDAALSAGKRLGQAGISLLRDETDILVRRSELEAFKLQLDRLNTAIATQTQRLNGRTRAE